MSVLQRISVGARLALLLAVAAGLWLNTLAPAGYMIAPSESEWLTVTPCPETHPLAQRAPIAEMDHAAMGHSHLSGDETKHDHEDEPSSNASNPCAFAGVTKLATGPVDSPLFMAALVFAMLLAVAAKPLPRFVRWVGLRPPLRGPPVLV